jgi:hypothetical protein
MLLIGLRFGVLSGMVAGMVAGAVFGLSAGITLAIYEQAPLINPMYIPFMLVGAAVGSIVGVVIGLISGPILVKRGIVAQAPRIAAMIGCGISIAALIATFPISSSDPDTKQVLLETVLSVPAAILSGWLGGLVGGRIFKKLLGQVAFTAANYGSLGQG